MTEYLPEIGEKCFFMHREVIVVAVWESFHLVRIKDIVNECLLNVDRCTLTLSPEFTNSISLGLFGGENK